MSDGTTSSIGSDETGFFICLNEYAKYGSGLKQADSLEHFLAVSNQLSAVSKTERVLRLTGPDC
jgi:hypothetical protein